MQHFLLILIGLAQRGFIDEVILPKDTRGKLTKAFAMLENKKIERPNRKHRNIPLSELS